MPPGTGKRFPPAVTLPPETDHSTERGRLHARIALRKEDVVHRFRRQLGTREQGLDHGRAELVRVEGLEHATSATDRRPQRLTNDGVAHENDSSRFGLRGK